MTSSSSYKVIIAGGGTGGHVFPAIAIANGIKAARTDSDILFVGAKGKLEMEKVPEAGYRIIGLNISGLQRKLSWRNLLFPFRLIWSLLKSVWIIGKFKPNVAVGVGGYASGPLLYVASRRRIPTVIQEQNSYPGITNKMLAGKAEKICVAYEGMEKFFPPEKIVLTGNPVRAEIGRIELNRAEACRKWGFDPERPVVLAVGGSLGARTINEAMLHGLPSLTEAGIQLLWQCGRLYYNELKDHVPDQSNTRLQEFIREMDWAYASADVIVSRAGALSISELCLVGKPVILVPSPNVAEDHQTHNAMALVERDAAIMVKDADAKETLSAKVIELLADKSRMKELSANIRLLAKPDATERIVQEVINAGSTK